MKTLYRAVRPFTLCLALFLSFSCAHQKSESHGEVLNVVDFSQDAQSEDITISEKASTDYGPAPLSGETDDAPSEEGTAQSQVIALDLYPSLYNSLGFISLFSELEREKIKVSIITSQGFSAVFGALYAKYETANLVEWKAFALYQALGESRPFSEEWSEKYEDFLTEEFGDERTGRLKKLFFVPKQVEGKTVFNSNERIVDALMSAIDLKSESNALLAGRLDYLSKINRFGADQVYRVSFLPKRISLKRPDGFIYGVYSKLSGRARGPYIFSDAIKGNIDAFQNLSDSVYLSREDSELFAKKIKQTLEKDSGKN